MSYNVSRVKWEDAAPMLKHIREQVFICEWRIPRRVEFDHKDTKAYHMLVCDESSQQPIATGRILKSGEISRVSVLLPFRKQRVDQLILKGLFEIASELALDEVFINSPLEAVEYFEQKCFVAKGHVFMEAGIPRQKMACSMANIAMAKYYLSH